ncbi:hypothetical protein GCM10010441_35760 [Kitasatospora paracochleata]|uniref:Uncharacterized protein n=1 Tax=Kitasatospora paracochleata TaxID=58354 RepID=A0ABT1J4N1_9ACTN|nr:hypothetical protein [Kitasatospora paracochleata]MCP2312088.1 hypothetical protein [Kitasatospora paracochleata]
MVQSQAGEPKTRKPRGAASELLHTASKDPKHLPEHLAIYAVHQEGPKAAAEVGKLSAEAENPQEVVLSRGARRAVLEGCLVGGPFILLIPVAFCTALLAQLRMALEIAALAGKDPNSTERVAELLVLQGVYPTVAAAEAGLAELKAQEQAEEGTTSGEPVVVVSAEEEAEASTRAKFGMIKRMAYLLGLIGSGGSERGTVRKVVGWAGMTLLIVIGVVMPMVWIPAMGYASLQGCEALGRRAVQYYGHGRPPPEGRAYWRPAMLLVVTRTVGAAVLPTVAFFLALAAGLDVLGSRPAAAISAAAAVAAGVAALRARRRHAQG